MKKKIWTLVIVLLCVGSFIFATDIGNIEEEDIVSNEQADYYENIPEYTFKTLKGEILEAGEVYEETNGYTTFKYQDVKVHIKDQGYNTTKLIKYSVSYYSDVKVTNDALKKGDKVYIYTTFENGEMTDTQISYRNNNNYIIVIIAMYAIVILLVGGLKGLKAIASLALTVLAVFYIILPRIIAGSDPILTTVLTCALITLVSIIIIAGFNKKATAAIIGTVGGIVIAGIFAVIFGNLMALSGVTEEARLLVGVMEESAAYNFRGILFAGIIIGALGACMDVSMSIASALCELKEENPHITVGKMIKAGMNIGRDMMGTMTNTLILAYTGGSLILIMIFMSVNLQFYEIINQEMMLEELLRAIAGSFGLVATIPFTTVVTSLLMGSKNSRG
ncbi:MAG: YibE/F family protein [Clostridia bacterium]|nr:YibE/F family protein [Clostridia bacterium]